MSRRVTYLKRLKNLLACAKRCLGIKRSLRIQEIKRVGKVYGSYEPNRGLIRIALRSNAGRLYTWRFVRSVFMHELAHVNAFYHTERHRKAHRRIAYHLKKCAV